MVFQPIKLDVDLVADRRKEGESAPLNLEIPKEIQRGDIVTIRILNHEDGNKYDISVTHGSFTYDNGLILYTAPSDYFGPVTLTIKHNNGEVYGYAVLEDGTVYDEDGIISQADKRGGGLSFKGFNITASVVPAEDIAPPVPTNTDAGIPNPAALQAYDITSLFGDIGSVSFTPAPKIGNVADYYLPSEQSRIPDAQRGLYQTQDGKFKTVPRNSNVTQSGGDIWDGYGREGDVGGSLRVIKGSNITERIDQWVFDIVNNELTAIMPEDIVSFCLTHATFTPRLVGDPKGHTFLWEQIKGDDTEITWLTPKNQPSMTVQIGAIKTDRTFRFWISKGTRYEKHYDVTIYGTPFENIVHVPRPVGYGESDNHLNIHVHDTGPILLWHRNVFNKELRVKVIRNN